MSSLSRFHAELDRLFGEAMKLASGEPRAGECQPSVDVVETETEVVMLVEVPGVPPDHLEVSVEGRTVFVAGRKRPRQPDGAVRFHRIEREEGRFERRVELLQPVNTRAGRARTENGLLVVSFPRVQEKRVGRRPLTIEAEPGPEERR